MTTHPQRLRPAIEFHRDRLTWVAYGLLAWFAYLQAAPGLVIAHLRDELGLSYVLVAHDLAVVRQVANRIAVMYLGTIVEEGPAAQVYEAPAHPYTKALLSAVPVPEPGVVRERIVLTGDVPTPISPPSGCPFRTRCYKAEDVCATERPVLEPVQGSTEHRAACYFPEPPPS